MSSPLHAQAGVADLPGWALVVAAEPASDVESVWEDIGALLAIGVPWDAAWDMPVERTEALLRGYSRAKGLTGDTPHVLEG